MDKIFSNIKERILLIPEYKGITKEYFFNKIQMTYANFKGSAKNRPINSDTIANILSIYPDINPDWLLTGNGEMLKADKPPDGQPLNADCQMCAIKDKLIASQEKTIAMLESQLKQCTDDQRDECQKNEKKAG